MLFCSTAATAAPEGDAGLDGGTPLRLVASSPCCTSVPASLDGSPGHTGRRVWRYRADSGPRPTGSLPQQWGDPDLPVLYATFGTVAAAFDTFTHVYARTLEALADEPVRALLTTGHSFDPESLRPWPANANVRQWWPQEQVMPLASAMVGHGGFGTTMAALEAGIPQVVVPLFAFGLPTDGRDPCRRVHGAAGRRHPRNSADGPRAHGHVSGGASPAAYGPIVLLP